MRKREGPVVCPGLLFSTTVPDPDPDPDPYLTRPPDGLIPMPPRSLPY